MAMTMTQPPSGEWRGWSAPRNRRSAPEELSHPAYFSHIARHDLSEIRAGEFQAELACCTPIARGSGWCARTCVSTPAPPAYLLLPWSRLA